MNNAGLSDGGITTKDYLERIAIGHGYDRIDNGDRLPQNAQFDRGRSREDR
jgi:hypothetical protein